VGLVAFGLCLCLHWCLCCEVVVGFGLCVFAFAFQDRAWSFCCESGSDCVWVGFVFAFAFQ